MFNVLVERSICNLIATEDQRPFKKDTTSQWLTHYHYVKSSHQSFALNLSRVFQYENYCYELFDFTDLETVEKKLNGGVYIVLADFIGDITR